MDELVNQWLGGVVFGGLYALDRFAVVPLSHTPESRVPYIALATALKEQSVTVTEASAGGVVGDLKVVNTGPTPVLVLDGEELAGAKQNRIVNTTILLTEHADTVIPVSCTEQGRWSYMSHSFQDSIAFAPPRMRSLNKEAVTRSVRSARGFRSDQSEVWDEVSRMSREAGVKSDTSAMRDVFSAHMSELDDLVRRIPALPGQRGLLVLNEGETIGFDMVSRPEVYEVLHPRLLRSYYMGARACARARESREPRQFIEAAMGTSGTRHASPGYGEDLRYQADGIVGSALTYDNEVIHVAFFRVSPYDQHLDGGALRTSSERRRYRM
jgi:hypothetical protein